ncbi:MAG: DUF4177 domain-containing protein [Ferruginibacter sp.]|nr:DUF4177 domain-containing protein [Cytophagales bacterium]
MVWEYKTKTLTLKKSFWTGKVDFQESDLEMSLNEVGSEGWEPVSVQAIPMGTYPANQALLVWKRSKP